MTRHTIMMSVSGLAMLAIAGCASTATTTVDQDFIEEDRAGEFAENALTGTDAVEGDKMMMDKMEAPDAYSQSSYVRNTTVDAEFIDEDHNRGEFAENAVVGTTTVNGATSSEIMISQVGGADMYSNQTIVANAVNSPVHTTLVSAVQAAGLVDTLNGPGPYTVFAPTDNAFAMLPGGTVGTLMEPANKDQLTSVLTYHVVPGAMTYADLEAAILAGGGRATLTTASGGTLEARFLEPDVIYVLDGAGGVSRVSQADVIQSNGVIHVVDNVLLPG